MPVRITLEREKKTCTDGRIICEFRIEPPPDRTQLTRLTQKWQVCVHGVGGNTFFRVDWKEDISVQGMVGDPILIITCPVKNREEISSCLYRMFAEKTS